MEQAGGIQPSVSSLDLCSDVKFDPRGLHGPRGRFPGLIIIICVLYVCINIL